ncbi:hypothetical protein O0L34_g15165 [Tuta absoluta]|nr:hypothetical protein O0L34_g15165 [Tuta absoluta]
MLIPAIAAFFKFKIVSDVVILACNWDSFDQVKLNRQLSLQGISSTFSCDPRILRDVVDHRFQGVMYIKHDDDDLLEKVVPEHFAHWYKWLIIGDGLPDHIHRTRYDSDITYIRSNQSILGDTILDIIIPEKNLSVKSVNLEDVYIHPRDGASIHPWATWSDATSFKVEYNSERIARRLNLDKFTLNIVSPVGYYSPTTYNGSFTEYLSTDVDPQRDSAIRCAYLTSSLIIKMLNATEVLLETHYWSNTKTNDSMLSMLQYEVADISGAILRILPNRIEILDYILPIWPFGVGFTYLAERESSTNMYVEPFSAGVWWSCLGIGVILAVAQRITAKRDEEKEGAFIGVLATWLQQDASAVPEGTSGRWSFLVMSISAMLVHAYYTSAIVSSLMSSGRGGPQSLGALGDSKYAIASEDYEYMRYLFWEVDTKWPDLEYLKKKKMKLSSLYVDIKKGVKLIKDGSTAFHAEYNNIYPYFNTLSDDQLCKLQYLATIPEQLSWTTATKRGQYTDVFRSRGAWLSETGLAYRIVFRLRMRPPPCRASLLAERVKFGDVAPLLSLTALGAILSFIVLGVEIAYVRARKKNLIQTELPVIENDEEAKIDQVEAYDYVN